MLHFKAPSFDREIFLLWTPHEGVTVFNTEEEAQDHFDEDHKDGRPALVFRFNPAYPGETRDITDDFLTAIEESILPPDDESDWDYHDGSLQERERPHLISSVGQWAAEANRRG